MSGGYYSFLHPESFVVCIILIVALVVYIIAWISWLQANFIQLGLDQLFEALKSLPKSLHLVCYMDIQHRLCPNSSITTSTAM